MIIRLITAAAVTLFAVMPAAASGNISCAVDDDLLTLTFEGIFSHGVGEALTEVRGNVGTKPGLGASTPGFADKLLSPVDVKQFWMHGRELKIRLYRDAEGEAAASLEVVIETTQDADDETVFSGIYSASVNRPNDKGETLSGTGPIACSVG